MNRRAAGRIEFELIRMQAVAMHVASGTARVCGGTRTEEGMKGSGGMAGVTDRARWSIPTGRLTSKLHVLVPRDHYAPFTVRVCHACRGEYGMGLREGFGTLRDSRGAMVFSGQWHTGRMHGRGRYRVPRGDGEDDVDAVYEGQFVDGKQHGHGTYQYQGLCYDGLWQRGSRSGHGVLRQGGVVVYEGEWRDGTMVSWNLCRARVELQRVCRRLRWLVVGLSQVLLLLSVLALFAGIALHALVMRAPQG